MIRVVLFLSFFFVYFKVRGEIHLSYSASFVLNSDFLFEGTRIGGLSSLFRGEDGLYWAVSDDKGVHGEPRIYGFQIERVDKVVSVSESFTRLQDGSLKESSEGEQSLQRKSNPAYRFKVIPKKMIRLFKSEREKFKKNDLDLEGGVGLGRYWLLASEGNYDSRPRQGSALMLFDQLGLLQAQLGLPDAWLPSAKKRLKKGLRSNGAIEGLSLSPNGRSLWVAAEQPLVQDYPQWKYGDASVVPFLKYEKSNEKTNKRTLASPEKSITFSHKDIGTWRLEKQFNYPIDKIELPSSKWPGRILGQGVSDIFTFKEDELWVLERAAYQIGFSVGLKVKLYSVKLPSGSKPAPQSLTMEPSILEKKLLLDFDDIKNQIDGGLGLDNFEGMTLGPIVDGSQTLLLVSDDNFNPFQHNLWVMLKIND